MIYFNFRIITGQQNAACSFNSWYLICNIPDNNIEVLVKIKTNFGKHTLVEGRGRRMVKYIPWGKCNQPKIKMEMAKKVAPLKLRKVKKEVTESGSSSDLLTWIHEVEGFGYPPKIFTDPNYAKEGSTHPLPVLHPTWYSCIYNDQESDWDEMVETYHPLFQTKIEKSWFLPGNTKKTSHGSTISNSLRPEKAQTPSECMKLD